MGDAREHRSPSDAQLIECLAPLFEDSALMGVQRTQNVFQGAFPSEVVVCHFDDGRSRSVFIKYGRSGVHVGHGFWRGVDYEVAFYRSVLQRFPMTTVRYVGSCLDQRDRNTWLVLQYLDPSSRLSKVPHALVDAARWLGAFHSYCEGDSEAWRTVTSARQTYSLEYYLGWIHRTADFASDLVAQHKWLPDVCRLSEQVLGSLAEVPQTVIHGEFYPNNVLIHEGRVFPVDWQSAALAAGAIDVASLVEGWNPSSAGDAIRAYCTCRWPNGTPPWFESSVAAARLYWPFRWLGDERHLTLQRTGSLRDLMEAAQSAGAFPT